MLKTGTFANALALAMGVFYVLCALLSAVAPDLFRSIGQAWIHSYNLSAIPADSLTASGFVWGLVTSVVTAWIFGYLLGWFYNKLAK